MVLIHNKKLSLPITLFLTVRIIVNATVAVTVLAVSIDASHYLISHGIRIQTTI